MDGSDSGRDREMDTCCSLHNVSLMGLDQVMRVVISTSIGRFSNVMDIVRLSDVAELVMSASSSLFGSAEG